MRNQILHNLISNHCIPPLPKHKPRILAIAGGKGGVGKSLTTANLGICLQNLGCRTLMIDGDFGLANLDMIMGLTPICTLDEMLSGSCSMEDVLLQYENGALILPASSGMSRYPSLGSIEKTMLNDHMDPIYEHIDLVMVDVPAGASEHVQEWVNMSDDVAIVLSPEPTSLTDGYALMKILRHRCHRSQFHLIFNMVSGTAEAHRLYEKMAAVAQEYLGARVDYWGHILRDENIIYSVKERTPCVKKYPFCGASQNIRELAQNVLRNLKYSQNNGKWG